MWQLFHVAGLATRNSLVAELTGARCAFGGARASNAYTLCMATVRPPAVAGTFYPGSAPALEGAVDAYVSEGRAGECAAPVVLIGPHAGYAYSGPVAGSAYAALRPHAEAFDRVVLIGPAHRVYVRGLAAPSVNFFRTPLGDVPLDRHAIELLVAEGLAHVDDGPHAPEHGIEARPEPSWSSART
jgi:AmmeMemoRadiSam system protein B